MPTVPVPSIILKSGSKGPAVTKLQQYLNQLGFAMDADGIFGSRTNSAVVTFQRSHSLAADGIVGPNTWEAISIALGMSLGITSADAAATTTPVNVPVPGTPGSPTPSQPVAGGGFWASLSTVQKGGLAALGVVGLLAMLRPGTRSPGGGN